MRTVRAATYNLYLGADLTTVFGVRNQGELSAAARRVLDQVIATDFPSRAAAVARVLVREHVDVVGLQEVATWSRVTDTGSEVWLDFLDELLAALANEGAGYDVHAATPSFHGGAAVTGGEEMSVLGRNVVLVRRGSGVEVLAERTGGHGRTLDIVTPMAGLVLNIPRSWGYVDLRVDGARFRFVNVHLEAWDAEVRAAQRDEVLAAVRTELPTVVVGDFNELPERVGMPEEYDDAWVVAGDGGPGRTCGQAADLTGDSSLDVRIDYVWVRGLEARRCVVAGDRDEDRTPSGLWPSDHACVVAELALPAEPS